MRGRAAAGDAAAEIARRGRDPGAGRGGRLTLLERLQDLLVVEGLGQALDGGERFLAVALLDADVHIILGVRPLWLLDLDFLSKGICSGGAGGAGCELRARRNSTGQNECSAGPARPRPAAPSRRALALTETHSWAVQESIPELRGHRLGLCFGLGGERSAKRVSLREPVCKGPTNRGANKSDRAPRAPSASMPRPPGKNRRSGFQGTAPVAERLALGNPCQVIEVAAYLVTLSSRCSAPDRPCWPSGDRCRGESINMVSMAPRRAALLDHASTIPSTHGSGVALSAAAETRHQGGDEFCAHLELASPAAPRCRLTRPFVSCRGLSPSGLTASRASTSTPPSHGARRTGRSRPRRCVPAGSPQPSLTRPIRVHDAGSWRRCTTGTCTSGTMPSRCARRPRIAA